MLDHFRAFEATGPLVRMIFQIIEDIQAFMLVLLVGCIAFATFFVIHMPLAPAFDASQEALGPAWPLFTTYTIPSITPLVSVFVIPNLPPACQVPTCARRL